MTDSRAPGDRPLFRWKTSRARRLSVKEKEITCERCGALLSAMKEATK